MATLEDTRKRLLESAGQLFAQRGFEATNVRDITRAAGTNLAAINYHFGSKEELYIEAVRHAARSCDDQNPMPTWGPNVPAEQRLHDFIRAFLTRMLNRDMPDWHRLLIFREVADPRPGACETFVRSFVRPTFAVLLSILRDMVPADVSPIDLHLLGGSIVGQCLHYHHSRHIIPLLVGEEESAAYTRDRLTEHLLRFSLAAIRGLYPQGVNGFHAKAKGDRG